MEYICPFKLYLSMTWVLILTQTYTSPFMKLCINSQDLQDFILTRLDLMKDMRKKGRIPEEDARMGGGIRNCTKPLLGINLGIKIDNQCHQKIKCPGYYWCWGGSCLFFYENHWCWFFPTLQRTHRVFF